MTFSCPCCGAPIAADRLPARMLTDVRGLPLQERRILEALVRAYPRAIDGAGLVDAVYFDRPDGGPLDAANFVQQLVSRLRRRLAPLGWTIPLAYRSTEDRRYRLEKAA